MVSGGRITNATKANEAHETITVASPIHGRTTATSARAAAITTMPAS
ncbi:Uncharacterised protein [Mycobacteroides abscessus]|nr:Uncharacterised protein [Mycobacteroides abscessus]